MVTIANKSVGKLGYGLLGLTIRAVPFPDSTAFALLKQAIASGSVFWNTGAFYGRPDPLAGLKLLNRYFSTYPEDRAKVFLSVKGCFTMMPYKLDASRQGVRLSVESSLEALHTYIDLFQSARMDPTVPVEETVTELQALVNEGKIRCIGLSECSADTIRRAARIADIAAVEQEYSLWSTEIEDNGVLQACSDLNIPVVAYSPLSRGFLTGSIKKKSDLMEGDIRHMMPRFSDENFPSNVSLVEKIEQFAARKQVKPSQVAIAWIMAQAARYKVDILPIPGTTSSDRLHENSQSAEIQMTSTELEELREMISGMKVHGGRYAPAHSALLFGDTPPSKGQDQAKS